MLACADTSNEVVAENAVGNPFLGAIYDLNSQGQLAPGAWSGFAKLT